MKLEFTSIQPTTLVKGKTYLCGKASLVDEIYWGLYLYDGKEFIPINEDIFTEREPVSLHDEFGEDNFIYSLDGDIHDWLMFELPTTGMPDNGAGGKGDLYYQLTSVKSPTGEKALLTLQSEKKVV